MSTAPARKPVDKGRPIFGPAVTEDRVLRYTSVSSMQSFDEEGSEGGCNRKWFAEKVLGWESPPSKGQKVGVEKHAESEHYYLTGEDIRTPITRATAHLLPKRGPDLHIEQAFGCHVEKEWITKLLRTESDPQRIASLKTRLAWVEEQLVLPGGTVPLLVNGLDLVGFIDMRHQRGEYIDPEGVLRPELPDHGLVVENVDLKFLGDLSKYAKPAHVMRKTIQMVQYACRVVDIVPGVQSVRSSHVNSQTQRALTAKKVTAIMPVSEVRALARRHDGLIDEMRHVARIGGLDGVRANPAACGMFGGCAHRKSGKCVAPGQTIYHFIGLTNPEGIPMSGNGLFDLVGKSPSPAPDFSEVAAAAASLSLADDLPGIPGISGIPEIPLPPGVTAAPIRPCGAPGCRAGEISGAAACPACSGWGVAGLTPVIPPDAPKHDLLSSALPLTPDAILEITDPSLRAKVEAHARAHAEQRAKEAAEKAASKDKPSGNCPGGKQVVALDPSKVKKRGNKYACPVCKKELGIKPSEDGKSAELPGHRIAKEEKAAAAGAPAPGADALPEIPGDDLPEIPDLPSIPDTGVPPRGRNLPGYVEIPGAVPGSQEKRSKSPHEEQIHAIVEEAVAPLRRQLDEILAAVRAR